MIDVCRPSYACALLLRCIFLLLPRPVSFFSLSISVSIFLGFFLSPSDLPPVQSGFSCQLLFLGLSPSPSLRRYTLFSPSLVRCSRSAPDLFFFCLNLVAIRGGHTPRQGRACTRTRTRECVRTGESCVRARIFDGFCQHSADPRRRSRSSIGTGADLCLVIRKLLAAPGHAR